MKSSTDGYDPIMAAETLANGISVGNRDTFDLCRQALSKAYAAGRDAALAADAPNKIQAGLDAALASTQGDTSQGRVVYPPDQSDAELVKRLRKQLATYEIENDFPGLAADITVALDAIERLTRLCAAYEGTIKADERLTRDLAQANHELNKADLALAAMTRERDDAIRHSQNTVVSLLQSENALAAEREAQSKLRHIISKCADALGNGAVVGVECSVGFMGELPAEIGLHVASLTEDRDEWKARAEAAEARVRELETQLFMKAVSIETPELTEEDKANRVMRINIKIPGNINGDDMG